MNLKSQVKEHYDAISTKSLQTPRRWDLYTATQQEAKNTGTSVLGSIDTQHSLFFL